MSEITADVLQRITLITPETSKEIIQELKTKLKNEELSYLDYKKLWKALFYAMWHCDKFFNQQTLAENISQILRVFYSQQKVNSLQLYVKAMLFVLTHEWDKVDYWRINKFLMMYRLIQEEIMKLCKHFQWKNTLITNLNQIYQESLFQNILNGEGLCLHFIQIYLQCLSKHTNLLNQENVDVLLEPFLNLLKFGDRKTLKDKALEFVFKELHKYELGTFISAVYAQKIQDLLQSSEVMLPANKKLLNEAVKALTKVEEEPVEVIANGDHNDQDDQIEMIQPVKPKKKKVKQQLEQDVEVVEETVPMAVKLDEVQLKKKKKSEKSQLKSTQVITNQDSENPQAGEQEIEGLNYSEVIQSQDRMKLLRDIMNTIPPYLFLSPAEKRKYFGNISKTYGDKITKEKGHQCSHQQQLNSRLIIDYIVEFKKTESALRVSQTQNNKRVKAM